MRRPSDGYRHVRDTLGDDAVAGMGAVLRSLASEAAKVLWEMQKPQAGNGMQTWYAHLSRFEVVPGQEIRRGEVLAYSGATGKVTAPHLHFEVRLGGSPVNPYPYLTRSAMQQHVQPDLPF